MKNNEMPKAYLPASAEEKWYLEWEKNGLFHGDPKSDKQPYSIAIPPPNVTGVLHLGHVLNNTLQDILCRWKRMTGYEVSWFPGTDHAGIATESKVEKVLRETENTGRDELGREKFIERVWEWKEECGGTIIKQLRRLGASCDWEKERFTMDEGLSDAVRKVFVSLYDKGYVYRGQRMINWCPVSKTALSDEEVIYKDVNGKFYHYKYPLSDGTGFLEIATTRPETMFGDTAVAVHPDDERYKDLVGKTINLPLTNRQIPIIADIHADPEKGTGCVKITPAHDPNDFVVGERNNLEFISVMNEDGSMNDKAGEDFANLDRFECRKKVIQALEEADLMVKIEDISHSVGFSERGDVPIESMISAQWFVNMQELAKPAIAAVKDKDIKFYPERWEKTYYHWMNNIKDWCISRQIWWGHRIPAWYHNDTNEIFVGMEAPKDIENWHQEEDVLDTWFSSWLWPFSVMGWCEETPDLEYFYPTSDLVTGPDIIFFWVARMIMAGYEFKDELPFKNVYFTSIIRDAQGRKLSKSLGNSPDPIDVIDQYGADALRFSIIYIAPIGIDIRYSNEKCEIGRNFANKLWNASRFRKMQGEVSNNFTDVKKLDLAKLTADDKWILGRVAQVAESVNKSLVEFKFNEATRTLYDFIWSEFCDWYIEACKQSLFNDETKQATLEVFDYVLFASLKMLHPFMPFVTEEIAHQLDYLSEEKSIMQSEYPTAENANFAQLAELGIDDKLLNLVEAKFDIIKAGRNLRANANIPPSKVIKYFCKPINDEMKDFFTNNIPSINKLMRSDIAIDANYESDGSAPSIVTDAGTLFMPLEGLIDVDAERKKLEKQKKELEGWIKASKGKLANPKFVSNAPAKLVEESREKLKEMEDKLERVLDNMEKL